MPPAGTHMLLHWVAALSASSPRIPVHAYRNWDMTQLGAQPSLLLAFWQLCWLTVLHWYCTMSMQICYERKSIRLLLTDQGS